MRALLAAALLLAGTSLSGCATGVESQSPKAGPAVRLELASGSLGSGVYIGNNMIVTAAHVVGDAKSVKVKSDIGDIQDAQVLWRNTDYDIAAIWPANSRRFNEARLDCRVAAVGERISAAGNPLGAEFITMHGYVSGAARQAGDAWKEVLITDMTTLPGMSGGPVYSETGEVVGITVGTATTQNVPVGLGMAVPSSVVCSLLGRAQG